MFYRQSNNFWFIAIALLCLYGIISLDTIIIIADSKLYASASDSFPQFGKSNWRNGKILNRYDQEQSPTNEHHNSRVQIKVYRGPDVHGEHDEHFAPFGYWVKQPADDERH